ncbi:MAG: hypothetical protein Q8J97_11220, partial [Flavobacteriaceae bacterium]|nr:hypothetical protein [Flavobacteriaceae bacterium]
KGGAASGPTSIVGGGGASPGGGGGGRRRRTKVLVAGVEQNPIFGLLCGITPPQLAAAYEEVRRESKAVAAAGLDPRAFASLLRRLVPHVDISDAYAEKMFDLFEATRVNNQSKRLQFADLIREFAQHAAPAETHRSAKFFFTIFEDPDAKGFLPIRCLDGDAVRAFAATEVVGNATIRWQKLATALSLDKAVKQLVARADDVLGHHHARHGRGGASLLETLRKRSQLQEATATTANRQALQQALASTMIPLDDLKHLIFTSARLYAAFNELTFPRMSLEQLVVGGSSHGGGSRPTSAMTAGGRSGRAPLPAADGNGGGAKKASQRRRGSQRKRGSAAVTAVGEATGAEETGFEFD